MVLAEHGRVVFEALPTEAFMNPLGRLRAIAHEWAVHVDADLADVGEFQSGGDQREALDPGLAALRD